ncbi:MAG: peptidoglycan DD-metalloendopeptidase family protein [Paludibacteraceae bacterium]|nr:peptidoglycan DD-metalloendopeptidase family protein [Paludibacteraceae bacterium]
MSKEFWDKLKTRRRIAVMDDQSLNELWSFRLSALGLTTTLVLMFILTIIVLSIAIVYTPARNILPGYNQNMREQLLDASMRLDSLENITTLQRQYLSVVRDITAGEISTDTLPAPDSLQLVFQTELLQAKREVSEEFVEQYEQKGKDNLQLFDAQTTSPVNTMFSPAHGVIIRHFNLHQGQRGILIQTPDNENVTAVMGGAVVLVTADTDGTYTVVMQHTNYTSVYRRLGVVSRSVGDVLRAGETLGLVQDQVPLLFELWKEGCAINPEEVIVF